MRLTSHVTEINESCHTFIFSESTNRHASVSCTKGQYVHDESCHAYERVQVLCVVQERVEVRASGLGFGSFRGLGLGSRFIIQVLVASITGNLLREQVSPDEESVRATSLLVIVTNVEVRSRCIVIVNPNPTPCAGCSPTVRARCVLKPAPLCVVEVFAARLPSPSSKPSMTTPVGGRASSQRQRTPEHKESDLRL